MRALCWHGKGDVRVDTVPDPKIQHARDPIINDGHKSLGWIEGLYSVMTIRPSTFPDLRSLKTWLISSSLVL